LAVYDDLEGLYNDDNSEEKTVEEIEEEMKELI
jgi:hypothetical protein